jgi:hypothetical protein
VFLSIKGPCFFRWKQENGFSLGHSFYELKWLGFTELAKIINKATASEISKDELMDWFENHKKVLED